MALAATSLSSSFPNTATACSQPDLWSVATAFDLAAGRLLSPSYPQLPDASTVDGVPPSILKSVGWVESGWRQFDSRGTPLVSFDFGYGVMQVTSGMAGAFGNVRGTLPPASQSRIASDYVYNIAYGARMLVRKWSSVPQVGDGDPAVLENWYYALWAYNGWGWVNNPNNPRFSRKGTPATNPRNFPYQERVLYLVSHPPRDRAGNQLWQPVAVSLPSRKKIGKSPGRLSVSNVHRQDPSAFSAVYRPDQLPGHSFGSTELVRVRITNTGTAIWPGSGAGAVTLTSHLFAGNANAALAFSPSLTGLLAVSEPVTPLGHDLLPGKTVSLLVRVNLPPKSGSYRLAWDLREGSGPWFSQLGVLPYVQIVRLSGSTSPSPSATPTSPPPFPKHLRFVADTSTPDGSILRPGQTFLKGWLVFNDGHVTWPLGSSLHLTKGSSFGAKVIAVPSTRSCHTANIVTTMRAPHNSGRYKGVWRMEDATHAFGEPLTVIVVVPKRKPAVTATPTPYPSPKPGSSVTPTPTPVG